MKEIDSYSMEFIFDLPDVPISSVHPTPPSMKRAKRTVHDKTRNARAAARGTASAIKSTRIVASAEKRRAS